MPPTDERQIDKSDGYPPLDLGFDFDLLEEPISSHHSGSDESAGMLTNELKMNMDERGAVTTKEDRAAQFEQQTATQRAEARQTHENEDELQHTTPSSARSDSEILTPVHENEEAEGVGSQHNPRPAAPTATFADGKGMHEKTADAPTVKNGAMMQSVSIFQMATGATEEEANDYVSRTNGSIPEAVHLYMATKVTKPQEQSADITKGNVAEEPKPLGLVDEALEAAKPRRTRRDGDLVIVPDVEDLNKTYRVRSDDVAGASPFFKAALMSHEAATVSAHGIKHLFILQKPTEEGGMPRLERKDLAVMRADCEDDFYKKPNAMKNERPPPLEEGDDQPAAEKIKSEEEETEIEVPQPAKDAANPDPPRPSETDWLGAYDIFIRLVARFESANYGISQTNIDAAVQKIELVAQIAKAMNTVSRVSSTLDSVFTNFMLSQQLWESIAADAARWLLIGINLGKALIYNEAFVHVAGCYPEWPWSVPMRKIPYGVMAAITAKSVSLDLARKDIERQLLVKSTAAKIPKSSKMARVGHQVGATDFSVISIFRDWLALHLDHLDCQRKVSPTTQSALCDHSSGECLTVAGLHRTISKGGDAYLPVDSLLHEYWNRKQFTIDSNDESTIRSTFRDIKIRAAERVAPLLASRLKFEGKDKLEYLTAIEVGDEDVPWDTSRKCDVENGDEDEDGDESD